MKNTHFSLINHGLDYGCLILALESGEGRVISTFSPSLGGDGASLSSVRETLDALGKTALFAHVEVSSTTPVESEREDTTLLIHLTEDQPLRQGQAVSQEIMGLLREVITQQGDWQTEQYVEGRPLLAWTTHPDDLSISVEIQRH